MAVLDPTAVGRVRDVLAREGLQGVALIGPDDAFGLVSAPSWDAESMVGAAASAIDASSDQTVADGHLGFGRDLTVELTQERLHLTDRQQQSLVDLGVGSAAAVESVLRGWRPGETDHQIAGRCRFRVRARGDSSDSPRRPHCLHSGEHAGAGDDPPGRVLLTARHDGEWRDHYQGGPIGYAQRECEIAPVQTDSPWWTSTLPEGSAVAFNPSIGGGAKDEDTYILGADGPRWITTTGEWPTTNDPIFPRPIVLDIEN